MAPPRALEPKVLVPHQPGPGRAPRKIVIERQKRLFALQDIHQLILDLGVDTAEPERPGAMSLEVRVRVRLGLGLGLGFGLGLGLGVVR